MSSQPEADPRFQSNLTLAVIVAAAILGPAVFLVLPAFVGALSDTFGFTQGQLGLLASADLMGMSLATATGLYWLRRWRWRPVVVVALAIVVVMNLVSMLLETFASLLVARFAAGCAGGMIMAIAMSFFALRTDPNRAAAWLIFAQVSFIVVALASLPPVVAAYGVDSIFAILAVLTSGLFLVVRWIPERAAPSGGAGDGVGGLAWRGVGVLVAIVFFFVGQSGLWGFIELIGEDVGLSAGEVATALVLSTIISLLGPAYGVVISERFGRRTPIVFALACELGVMGWLAWFGYGFYGFVLLLSIFQFGWNLAISYQFATLVQHDVSRRLVVLVPTSQGLGIALGPLLVGTAIEASGYTAAPLFVGATLIAYGVLMVPLSGHSGYSGGRWR